MLSTHLRRKVVWMAKSCKSPLSRFQRYPAFQNVWLQLDNPEISCNIMHAFSGPTDRFSSIVFREHKTKHQMFFVELGCAPKTQPFTQRLFTKTTLPAARETCMAYRCTLDSTELIAGRSFVKSPGQQKLLLDGGQGLNGCKRHGCYAVQGAHCVISSSEPQEDPVELKICCF